MSVKAIANWIDNQSFGGYIELVTTLQASIWHDMDDAPLTARTSLLAGCFRRLGQGLTPLASSVSQMIVRWSEDQADVVSHIPPHSSAAVHRT
jgi:hypothetical protein